MFDEIHAFLTQHAVPFVVHEHVASVTVQDVTDNLSFPVERILKTVVFRIKGGDWILAAVRGLDRVDYRKLGAALGVARRDVIRPSAEDIETHLGFEIGGVCPIPLREGVQVIFDAHTLIDGVTYCGAGRSDRTLALRVADLVSATNGLVTDIVQDTQTPV